MIIASSCVSIAVLFWLYPDLFKQVKGKIHSSFSQQYREQIGFLGLSIKPETIAIIRLVGFAAGIILSIILLKISPLAFLAGIAVSLASLIIPGKVLNYLEKKRIQELDREFPIMVALVRVFSKASDLYRALFVVRDAVTGELHKQLNILAQEMAVYPMAEVLNNFAVRCKYMPISNFVSVIQYGIITGSDIDDILASFSQRTYSNRVNKIRRKNKVKPIIMTLIPAFMMAVFVLLLIVPMFTNIITKLNQF
jgi:pilus assembly protein TadC